MILDSPFPTIEIPEKSVSEYVFERIQKYGDDLAMVDITVGKSLTFRQMYDRAYRCASALHEKGLRCRDVVAVYAASCIEYPVIMLAVTACGATMTAINPSYKEGEVIQQFNISEPRMVFCDTEAAATIKRVADKLECIKAIYSIGEGQFTTMDTLIQNGDPKDFPRVTIDAREDVALLLYSSGTTGLPKSVMLTHYNVLAAMSILSYQMQVQKRNTFYGDRPMYHIGGYFGIFLCLQNGLKFVLEREFSPNGMLKAVESHKVTHSVITPPVAISLSQTLLFNKYDTSSLEEMTCGGATVAPSLIDKLKERYNVTVSQGYGMTEFMTIAVGSRIKASPQSVGVICANAKIKIVDLQTGEALGPGTDGEIVAKGPVMMKGYLKNTEATSAAIDKDGWIHTGDIGHYDEDGMLYVVDRIKSIIKYKTFQVPPAELESVLLKHPKIADVGIVGIPDAHAGEIPKAFVVKLNPSLTRKEVIQFVEEELADYKHLRGGVEFVDEIPKSTLGKILRGELKKMATKGNYSSDAGT